MFESKEVDIYAIWRQNRSYGLRRGFWRFGTQPVYPAYPAAPARTVPVRYEPVPAQQYQPYTPTQVEYRKEDEVADLKDEKELIERELKAIDERIRELEKK
jgi:hypothetical protein